MRIKAQSGKNLIHILIDSGITHNFLDLHTAKKLGCKIQKICPLPVCVADGNEVYCDLSSKAFSWKLQGQEFKSDMLLLPLGGCEMVLGIQWLSILGDIKCNFKDLKMEFVYNGAKVILRGTKQEPVQWIEGKGTSKKMVNQVGTSMAMCVSST